VTDDLVHQLGGLRRCADNLLGILQDAQDRLPERAEGADRSRAVEVEIGPDGLPTRFRVTPDWQRRLRPNAFGAAVAEACQGAASVRLANCTPRPHQRPAEPGATRTVGGPPPDVPPRPLTEITQDLLRAFDDLAQAEHRARRPDVARGVGGGGRLTMTLSASGHVTCTAEARWVATQTGAQLTRALDEALADGRAHLVSAPPAGESIRGLDGLFAEAMATLNDLHRLGG
jgi:hypothetical protein